MRSFTLISVFIVFCVLINNGFSAPLSPHEENKLNKPIKTGPQAVITIGDKIRAADLRIIETKLEIRKEKINENLDLSAPNGQSKDKSSEIKKEEDEKKIEESRINENAEENPKDDEETETEVVTEVVTEIIEEEGTTIVYEDDDETTTEMTSSRA